MGTLQSRFPAVLNVASCLSSPLVVNARRAVDLMELETWRGSYVHLAFGGPLLIPTIVYISSSDEPFIRGCCQDNSQE